MKKIVHWFDQHSPFGLPFFLVVLFSVLLGFLVTYVTPIVIDDSHRELYSEWLLFKYGLAESGPKMRWIYYAPLWDFILGLSNTFLFGFLHDPLWVRHALTFALLPITFYLLFVLLRKAGISRATSALVLSGVFGVIRFSGQAYVNSKDFPAAAAFLLVSIALWLLLRNGQTEHRDHRYTVLVLVSCGIVAIVPYLIRTPLLLHAVVLIGFLTVYALVAVKISFLRRISMVAIPIIAIIGFLYLSFPTTWEKGLFDTIIGSVDKFQDYRHSTITRLFGVRFHPSKVPWWYVFGWLPVIIHPVVLLCSIVGFVFAFTRRHATGYSWKMYTRIGTIDLSLQRWLWSVLILSWASVVILQPRLYSEERHVLFLYPLLITFSMLGLDFLREKTKMWLATLLVLLSLTSYMQWGRFSYMYKSILVPDRSASAFVGEYWRSCAVLAMNELPKYIPLGSIVWTPSVGAIPKKQLERASTSRFAKLPELADYEYTKKKPQDVPHAAIVTSVYKGMDKIMRAVTKGDAELLWGFKVPPDEYACVILWYPNPPKD